MIYEIGDVARLRASFRDADNFPADPTTVSLVVQAPNNTQITYTYDALEIQRSSVGEYFYDLSILQAGAYLYQYTGTGAIQAVEEGRITVQSTTLVPQPYPPLPPPPPAAFTITDLAALNAAIASGAQEVRFQDRTVVYRSVKDMLLARTLMLSALGMTLTRQIRMETQTGL